MAKAKTFADKIAKSHLDYTKHCPECGESISSVMVVAAERSEKTGAYRFKDKFVKICKCNQSDFGG